MLLSLVLPSRHQAQWSENLLESAVPTKKATQLAQIFTVLQPEWREANPRSPSQGIRICAMMQEAWDLPGHFLITVLYRVLLALRKWNPREHLLWVTKSECRWWWLVHVPHRSGYCSLHVEICLGPDEGGTSCFLISNNAEAEVNAQVFEELLNLL